jgi:hypothetical protein
METAQASGQACYKCGKPFPTEVVMGQCNSCPSAVEKDGEVVIVRVCIECKKAESALR